MTSSGSSTSDLDHIVDDFYFLALHDANEIFPISDEKYAEELQLQEALVHSSAPPIPSVSPLSSSKQKQPMLTTSSLPVASKNVEILEVDPVLHPNKRHKSSDSMKSSTPEIFPYSALHDANEIFPISDEKYAEELQLQEALIHSSAPPIPSVSPLSSSKQKQPMLTTSSLPVASKSKSSYIFCNICMDTKSVTEMFRNNKACSHQFCNDCIREHVAAKIKQNQTSITCPDPKCKAKIGPEVCVSIVPNEVLERWDDILCESLIMETHKFYCPFKDCSAMMVNDGGVSVTSSECPNCHRLFCAQCKVSWHCGMNCVEYQSKKKGVKSPDESLLIDLAKKKKWMKCSKCNYFVEKVSGCLHITCRCGHHFCYGCGGPYIGNHVCVAKLRGF